MSENFDPYYKWLQIPPEEQPPSLYRLLGLRLFEFDREVIQIAADQRTVHLRTFQTSRHARLSQKLLNEVAAARICLLNRETKAAYDAQLRAQLAIPCEAPPVATAPVPTPTVFPRDGAHEEETTPFVEPLAYAAPSADPATFSPAPRARRRQRRTVWTMLGPALGAVFGLMAGYLVLCLIGPQYDFLHLIARTPNEIENATPKTSPPVAPENHSADRAQASRPSIPDRPAKVPHTAAPPSSATVREVSPPITVPNEPSAATTNVPPGPPEQISKVEVAADPLADLPSAIDLPTAQDTVAEPAIVGRFAAPQPIIIDLQLANPEQDCEHRFLLKRIDDQNVYALWAIEAQPRDVGQTVSSPNASVASLSISERDLRFQWSPQVTLHDTEALRNCVLQFRTVDAERTVRLRKKTQVDALTIDGSTFLSQRQFSGDGLNHVARQLRLKITGLDSFPSQTEIITGPEAEDVRDVLVRVTKGPPGLAVRVALDDNLAVTTEVVFIPPTGSSDRVVGFEQCESTLKALEARQDRLRKKVADAEAHLDRQIANVPKASGLDAKEKKAAIEKLRNQKDRGAIKKDKDEITALAQRTGPLRALGEQLSALRRTAKINLKVFYLCEGVPVDVWSAGYDSGTPSQVVTTATKSSVPEVKKRGERTVAFADSRQPAFREIYLREYGGDEQTEASVAAALKWLVEHQNPDGSWYIDHQRGPCKSRCANPGKLARSDVAATGLALLPLLGAGNSPKAGAHKVAVRKGLDFLIAAIHADNQGGDLSYEQGNMYGHGLASQALCEAYGMTKDPKLAKPAQQVVDFILDAQDPAGGGWRYQPRQPGDTSVLGWQMSALRAARLSGLSVPDVTFQRAAQFLKSVETDGGSAYGYTTPGRGSATSAIGLLCRLDVGWDPSEPAFQRGIATLDNHGPSAKNLYFNYYATQALFQHSGLPWQSWNTKQRDILLKAQSQTGHEKGSWYFEGDHSEQGGRLYCTALAALTLETYYRYPRSAAATPQEKTTAAPQQQKRDQATSVPDAPHELATYRHIVPGRAETKLTLLSNGTIRGSTTTWRLDDKAFVLQWMDPGDTAWRDDLRLIDGGAKYVGVNQNGVRIDGEAIQLSEEWRDLVGKVLDQADGTRRKRSRIVEIEILQDNQWRSYAVKYSEGAAYVTRQNGSQTPLQRNGTSLSWVTSAGGEQSVDTRRYLSASNEPVSFRFD